MSTSKDACASGVDCIPNNSPRQPETYQAKYLFKKDLLELMHLDNLSTIEFSAFQDSSSLKVNYLIKSRNTPEGHYNLIFILEQINGDYYLAKRTFVSEVKLHENQ